MKLGAFFPLLLAAFLVAQSPAPKAQQKRKAAPKPQVIERYDPEHLGPGEVGCGREKPGADACKCMEHRIKASQEAQGICDRVSDRLERAKCMVANEACAIIPTDVDSAGYNQDSGERMPSQCKRSCTKARCECCRS